MKLRHALFSVLALSAIAAPARAAGPLTIFDMDFPFQCSKPADNPSGSRLSQKYETYTGIYSADSKTSKLPECTFTDPEVKKPWHPLFPAHPAEGDQTCKIATEHKGD